MLCFQNPYRLSSFPWIDPKIFFYTLHSLWWNTCTTKITCIGRKNKFTLKHFSSISPHMFHHLAYPTRKTIMWYLISFQATWHSSNSCPFEVPSLATSKKNIKIARFSQKWRAFTQIPNVEHHHKMNQAATNNLQQTKIQKRKQSK